MILVNVFANDEHAMALKLLLLNECPSLVFTSASSKLEDIIRCVIG